MSRWLSEREGERGWVNCVTYIVAAIVGLHLVEGTLALSALVKSNWFRALGLRRLPHGTLHNAR